MTMQTIADISVVYVILAIMFVLMDTVTCHQCGGGDDDATIGSREQIVLDTSNEQTIQHLATLIDALERLQVLEQVLDDTSRQRCYQLSALSRTVDPTNTSHILVNLQLEIHDLGVTQSDGVSDEPMTSSPCIGSNDVTESIAETYTTLEYGAQGNNSRVSTENETTVILAPKKPPEVQRGRSTCG